MGSYSLTTALRALPLGVLRFKLPVSSWSSRHRRSSMIRHVELADLNEYLGWSHVCWLYLIYSYLFLFNDYSPIIIIIVGSSVGYIPLYTTIVGVICCCLFSQYCRLYSTIVGQSVRYFPLLLVISVKLNPIIAFLYKRFSCPGPANPPEPSCAFIKKLGAGDIPFSLIHSPLELLVFRKMGPKRTKNKSMTSSKFVIFAWWKDTRAPSELHSSSLKGSICPAGGKPGSRLHIWLVE